MSETKSYSSSEALFDEIEAALASSAGGRAFLAEFARRARSEEMTALLEAVHRLEQHATSKHENLDQETLRLLLSQVERTLDETKAALLGALATYGGHAQGGDRLGVIQFRRETTDTISGAAELIQETVWALREAGLDKRMCDKLESQASTIYAACRHQERMLDGLATVDRSLGRTEAHILELRRALQSPAAMSMGEATGAFGDGDIAFVSRPTDPDTPPVE